MSTRPPQDGTHVKLTRYRLIPMWEKFFPILILGKWCGGSHKRTIVFGGFLEYTGQGLL